MGVRVNLRNGGAANSSPPPCGEGLGVGVGRGGKALPQHLDPPPQPSPTRGEGAAAGRLSQAICIAALVTISAMPARAQGALPPGEGRDLMATACSQCHSLNVIRSMREGEEGWKRHVYNMVTRGAQLNAHEADMVIAYLAASFGPTAAPATSPVKVALPGGPGRDLVEERCTACHDLERVAIKRQKTAWPALVANMVDRGAVATPDEAQTIASYLTTNFGGE